MNKTQIHAEIVAHSLSPQGDELISVLATFPRIILAEINTHRMLSKNTSSSRAIPFKKMVEAIQNDPFIPIAWQENHSGMQGNKYLNPNTVSHLAANKAWLRARDSAVKEAKELNDEKMANVTKQLCNRLLEPFMWTTMLITGSKEGWDNFFNLRCPQYHYLFEFFKSRKEILKASKNGLYNDGRKLSDFTELDWLKVNAGQAEIHLMDLAEKIYDTMNESTPKQLKAGEWHIPMISDLESVKLSTDEQIKLSVGRAANTSYTVIGDGKELTLEQAVKIHDKCKELNHSSVFEHCARVPSQYEYDTSLKVEEKGWFRNYKGFKSYRHIIETNN